MIRRLATLLLCVTLGQSASAQTAVLCTAQEQWTFAEEIGRPASWAFNVILEVQGDRLTKFEVGGLRCNRLFDVFVNNENLGFTCSLDGYAKNEVAEFTALISRLQGDFLMQRTYGRSNHLDGVTIGYCERGSRRF